MDGDPFSGIFLCINYNRFIGYIIQLIGFEMEDGAPSKVEGDTLTEDGNEGNKTRKEMVL